MYEKEIAISHLSDANLAQNFCGFSPTRITKQHVKSRMRWYVITMNFSATARLLRIFFGTQSIPTY